MGRRYCVVSPCRDEQNYLERSLNSILAQTEPPTTWIIVDDGSTDGTPEILDRVVGSVPNVRIVRSREGGRRVLGSGVVRAFNFGLSHVDLEDFDFVCKLDLDLELPADYFARVLDVMEAEPRLGTLSGKPYFCTEGGDIHWEICGDENSVGMVKFYRRAAFEDIGGLVPELMWDAIDCHELRLRGWRAASSTDPRLAFEHLRPMGSSDRSVLRGRARHGRGQFFMGTGALFMLASALRRVAFPPVVLGSLAMLYGYFRAALDRTPRYGNHAFRRELRRFQYEALVMGKKRATRRWDERMKLVKRGALSGV